MSHKHYTFSFGFSFHIILKRNKYFQGLFSHVNYTYETKLNRDFRAIVTLYCKNTIDLMIHICTF